MIGSGVVCLLFLFLYSRIRNPYFHLIPAPMWVVVGSIGIGYYYALVLNKEVPIDPELLIKIPDQLFCYKEKEKVSYPPPELQQMDEALKRARKNPGYALIVQWFPQELM